MKPHAWLGYTVEVNDLLPTYDRLLTALASNGIPVDDTFGSSSDPPDIPADFTVYWDSRCDEARVREVLRTVSQFGLQNVLVGSDDEFGKRIIIGAYYEDYQNPVAINDLLLSMLLDSKLPRKQFLEIARDGLRPRTAG